MAAALASGALAFSVGCATDAGSTEEPVHQPGTGGAGEAGRPPFPEGDLGPAPVTGDQGEVSPPSGDDEPVGTSSQPPPSTPPPDDDDPDYLVPELDEATGAGDSDAEELGDGEKMFPEDSTPIEAE